MPTTIQISEELKAELAKRKLSASETYEDIIWDLIEDSLELNKETKDAVAKAREDYNEGKVRSHEEVKSELGL